MRFDILRPGHRFYSGGREHVKLRRTLTGYLGGCAMSGRAGGNSISLCDGELQYFRACVEVSVRRKASG